MTNLRLHGIPGWGSTIIEAQLAWYGEAYEFVEWGDLFKDAKSREALAKINPLAQVPTLELGDGQIMTESAAITLWLAEVLERNDLVPPARAPERAQFLRWLIFLVANVYPTYTYADDPARFVADPVAATDFGQAVSDHAKKLYGQLETAAGVPWFLGHRMSALDLYLGVMTRWRPGQEWFCVHAPGLFAIGNAIWTLAPLRIVHSKNFPKARTD